MGSQNPNVYAGQSNNTTSTAPTEADTEQVVNPETIEETVVDENDQQMDESGDDGEEHGRFGVIYRDVGDEESPNADDAVEQDEGDHIIE